MADQSSSEKISPSAAIKKQLEDLLTCLHNIGKELPNCLISLSQVVQPQIPSDVRVPLLGKMFSEVPSFIQKREAAIADLIKSPPENEVAFRLLLDLRQVQQILNSISYLQLLHLTNNSVPPGSPQQQLKFLETVQEIFQTLDFTTLEQYHNILAETPLHLERQRLLQLEPQLPIETLHLIIELLKLPTDELKPFKKWIENLPQNSLILMVNLLQMEPAVLIEIKRRIASTPTQEQTEITPPLNSNVGTKRSRDGRRKSQTLQTYSDPTSITNSILEQSHLNFTDSISEPITKKQLINEDSYNFYNSTMQPPHRLSLEEPPPLMDLGFGDLDDSMQGSGMGLMSDLFGDDEGLSTLPQESTLSHNTSTIPTSILLGDVNPNSIGLGPQDQNPHENNNVSHQHQQPQPQPQPEIQIKEENSNKNEHISVPISKSRRRRKNKNNQESTKKNKTNKNNVSDENGNLEEEGVEEEKSDSKDQQFSFEAPMPGPQYQLRIAKQPPAKTVYQRILKPFPAVMLLSTGGQELDPANNLFVEATLLRSDSDVELPLCLDGNRIIRISTGVFAVFKKLKILSTSQQQGTLFRLRFQLKRYVGNVFQNVAIASTISNAIEVFSHTQYLQEKKNNPPPPPCITEILPQSGKANTRVAILGTNFHNSPNIRVTFGDTVVKATFWETGTLICTSPPLMKGQRVRVRVSNDGRDFCDNYATFEYCA